jgi:hypothetical protein
MSASMHPFIAWLYETPVSTTIRDVSWIVPAVQSVHIMAIAVVLGSALVCDLRLAGLFATDEPAPTVVRRYLPWTWGALATLLLTGLVMSIGEPDRVLVNQTFWLKMGLVVAAVVLTRILCTPFMDPLSDPQRSGRARWIKPAAWLSLALWVGVIFCGRWIAYSI